MNAINIDFQINNKGNKLDLKLQLDLNQPTQNGILQSLQATQTYEPCVFKTLLNILQPGDTFIDIGAHVGFFTVLAGHLVGPTGHIIAVEPIEENFKALEQHVKINDLSNTQLINAIISEIDGDAEIYFNADNDGGHALWDPGAHQFNQKSQQHKTVLPVASKTLDTLLNENKLSTVKSVKIDTEGAEVNILRASQNILKQQVVDFFICELNGFALAQMGFSQDDLFACVRNHGYEIYLPQEDGSLPRHLPLGSRLESKYIINLLIAKPQLIPIYWPIVNIIQH